MSAEQKASIAWVDRAMDGLPTFGYNNAKVQCPECDGWTGVTCPHGCGVRLVSTQAEDDAAFRARMRAEEAERRARRDERRARRKAGAGGVG